MIFHRPGSPVVVVVLLVALSLPMAGVVVADVEPTVAVADDDVHGPVISGDRHWHGQNLLVNGSADNASEVHELRTTGGNLVTEFMLDEDGNAVLRTERFPTGQLVIYNATGQPIVLDEDGTVDRVGPVDEAAWSLIAQQFDVRAPDVVHTDEAVEFRVDSNRAGYPLLISSETIAIDDLDAYFDGEAADTTGDGEADAIHLIATDYEIFETDLTDVLGAGEYEVTFRSADTGVSETVTFEITDPIDVETLDAVWHGQTIVLNDTAANAGEIYEVRTSGGELITQFILDEHGNATLETTRFPVQPLMVVNHNDEPIALDQSGTVVGSTTTSEATWTVREQTIGVTVTSDEFHLDEQVEILVNSNRAGYPLHVTSDDVDVDDLAEALNASTVDVTDDGFPDAVELEAAPTELLTPDLGGVVGPGAYNITFTAADTGVNTAAEIVVIEPTEVVRIGPSLISAERMDVVQIPLRLDGTTTGELRIQSQDGEYEANVQVRDGNRDGTVVVEMNTFLAGWTDDEAAAFSTADPDDSIEAVVRDGEVDGVLEPTELTLRSGTDGEAHDSAILAISDHELAALGIGALPFDADVDDAGDLANVRLGDRVAHQDYLLVAIDASVTGFLTADYDLAPDSDDADTYGAYLEVVEAATGSSADLDVAVEGVFPDIDNRTVYVVLDTAPMNLGDHEATFTLDDRNPAVESGEVESLERSLNVTERAAFFSDYDAENGTIEIVSGGIAQTHRIVGSGEESALAISGNTTVAEGTELFVRMEDPDGSLLATATAEVSQRGNWNVRLAADEDDLEIDEQFVFIVQDDLGELEATVTGTIVESSGIGGGFDHLGPQGSDDDDDASTTRNDDDDDGIMSQMLPLLAILAALGGAVYYVMR